LDDDTLLTRYARDGSDAAFGQLVARHLSLVYSTCLRETGSPSLAEDAAQVVFLLLARKAKTLHAAPSLAGWLFNAARFVAKDVRKQEARRQRREQTVMQEMTQRQETPALEWGRVEPLLNDALAALKPQEREAVLLRFIEGHSLAETGAALALSEDAARMRVSRAVEKMRRYLTSHGVPVTSLILTGLLASEAARPVPAHAAAAIMGGMSQAISTGPTANLLQLSEGVYRTMRIIKLKVAALAAGLVLGGVALPPLVKVLASPVPPTEPAAQAARTQILLLQHTVAGQVLRFMHWDHSANLPGGVTQIKSLPAQNALAVTATPAGLAKVQEIVKALDIEPRQVLIKFALAHPSDADLKASGIKFELALLDGPSLKPVFVKYATGNPVVQFFQTLTKQGVVRLAPDITTTDDVKAIINFSNSFPAQEAESLTFSVMPHVNGDASVTLTLHLIISSGTVTHEINIIRPVKNGDTLVIVMPPVASQSGGKNLLVFVTPTVKVK